MSPDEIVIGQSLIEFIKKYIRPMEKDDRHAFISEIMEDYCYHCGEQTPCYCMRDD